MPGRITAARFVTSYLPHVNFSYLPNLVTYQVPQVLRHSNLCPCALSLSPCNSLRVASSPDFNTFAAVLLSVLLLPSLVSVRLLTKVIVYKVLLSFLSFFLLVKEVRAFASSCSSCSSSFRETPYRLPLMVFSCQTFFK